MIRIEKTGDERWLLCSFPARRSRLVRRVWTRRGPGVANERPLRR